VSYEGTVKDGVVVLPPEAKLPEGAKVQVTPVAAPQPDNDQSKPGATLYETLRDFVGIFKGLPADFAKNHDHYIHGTTKRP
jgi:hypothetical protein